MALACSKHTDTILPLERELERVRIARNDLKLHLARVPGRAARQSVFCPMTCLEEILGYCVPSKEDYRREGVPFLDSELRRLAKKPLLLLAQVCYRWNQIVMQTPKFSSTTAVTGRNLPMCISGALARSLNAVARASSRLWSTATVCGLKIQRRGKP